VDELEALPGGVEWLDDCFWHKADIAFLGGRMSAFDPNRTWRTGLLKPLALGGRSFAQIDNAKVEGAKDSF